LANENTDKLINEGHLEEGTATILLWTSERHNKTATNANKAMECDPVTELSLKTQTETTSTPCFEIQRELQKTTKWTTYTFPVQTWPLVLTHLSHQRVKTF
jgi:hypothetical protein